VNQHYLITGGSGFIGFALAQALRSDGHQVTLIDRVPPPFWRGAKFIRGDISSSRFMSGLKVKPRVDAVLHLAAQTSARISQEKPILDVDSNAKGTLQVLEWSKKNEVRRILYASSMAVYGQPLKPQIHERVPPAPVSNYGVSKLAGEHYLQAYKQYGIAPTIFRLFNVYGPGQNLKNLKQGMVSIYLAYLLKKKEIPITGSLERFRDFICVADVVRAWQLALTHPVTIGKTYNLGTGTKTTVRELLDVLIDACGHNPSTYPTRQISKHAGDQFGLVSDSTLFQQDTGWKPLITLPQGIGQMVRWARSSPK
jgi:UDP-glucose 4-epimerase